MGLGSQLDNPGARVYRSALADQTCGEVGHGCGEGYQAGGRAAVLVALIVLVPAIALAHQVYESAYVWYSADNQFCLNVKSLLEFDSTNTPTQWRTQSQDSAHERAEGVPGGQCDGPLHLYWDRPANSMRVLPYLYVYGSAGWGICRTHAYAYNQTTTWRFSHFHDWSRSTIDDCGHNWYGLYTLGQIWHNGKWRGNTWVWSGAHWWTSS